MIDRKTYLTRTADEVGREREVGWQGAVLHDVVHIFPFLEPPDASEVGRQRREGGAIGYGKRVKQTTSHSHKTMKRCLGATYYTVSLAQGICIKQAPLR